MFDLSRYVVLLILFLIVILSTKRFPATCYSSIPRVASGRWGVSVPSGCAQSSPDCGFWWYDERCGQALHADDKALQNVWIVVTGDSIGRLFFRALLENLGLCNESLLVQKSGVGYVFNKGTLNLAYVGTRYPEDITNIAVHWSQDTEFKLWNNASNSEIAIPAPNVWVANSGLHAMLYRYANDSQAFGKQLDRLKVAARALTTNTSKFWLTLPSIHLATLPEWKRENLDPSQVFAWDAAQLSQIHADFVPLAAPANLPNLLLPMDGIHPPVCAFHPIAQVFLRSI